MATSSILSRCAVLGYDVGSAFAPITGTEPVRVYFHAWNADDEDCDDDDDECCRRQYVVRGFGQLSSGHGITVVITSFRPSFYIKCLCDDYLPQAKQRIYDHVRGLLIKKYKIHSVQLVPRIDFWGFHNGKTEAFLKVEFEAISMRNWTAKQLMKDSKINVNGALISVKLYESNLDPLLRFFHLSGLQPMGWGRVQSYDVLNLGPPRLCVQCDWTKVRSDEVSQECVPPSVIASFDIECDSSHGDFPVPVKDYQSLAIDCEQVWSSSILMNLREYEVKKRMSSAILEAFSQPPLITDLLVSLGRKLHFKNPHLSDADKEYIKHQAHVLPDDIYTIFKRTKSDHVQHVTEMLNAVFVKRYPLEGDPIIQIGTTISTHPDSGKIHAVIFTLGSCSPITRSDNADEQTIVRSFDSESHMLMEWVSFIRDLDPDFVVGYNIFGFDMWYMHERAKETMGAVMCNMRFCKLGRIYDRNDKYVEKELSSSALGDNILKFIEMPGRTCIDLMKVVQRDHRLESYKLDNVAKEFLGDKKQDITPKDIFRLQKGDGDDRRTIAEYCIQDCALCNRLMDKLKIVPNNGAMANVCCVPLTYIFMRGQGVKIFSLVAKQCRVDNMVIPTLTYDEGAMDTDGYEGAIVLDPHVGMYLARPVSVLDYNSLYPSSMISHNLSHDTLVMDPKYDYLPDVTYHTVTYDHVVCKYVSNTVKKGVLPRILETLLQARKQTRKRMQHVKVGDARGILVGNVLTTERGEAIQLTDEEVASCVKAHSAFEISVLDGEQLAYKVTANSLYGQMGARTSPLYLKHIAACTTAVGRQMITTAKEFVENKCGAKVVYGDSVTGYTPVVLNVVGRGLVVRAISDIETFSSGEWQPCEGDPEKESISFQLGTIFAWSDGSWTEVECVIRHRLGPSKRIKHVQTNLGFVHVTDDHSLLLDDGTPIKASETVLNTTMLMHMPLPRPGSLYTDAEDMQLKLSSIVELSSFVAGLRYKSMLLKHGDICVPEEVLNHLDYIYRIGFLLALCDNQGSSYITVPYTYITVQAPIASICLLAYGCGYSVNVGDPGFGLSTLLEIRESSDHLSPHGDVVRRVYDLPSYPEDYVYDLTTANHHFQAGIGTMVVHNTDSIFMVFDKAVYNANNHRDALSISITEGKHASSAIKPLLPYPHHLEYEKTMFPLILLSKKRYVGLLYEDDPDAVPKQKSMGIALKRRDYAPIVKTVYGGVIDIILHDRDIPKATLYLTQELTKLAHNDYNVSDLVISKTLKSHYKLPHTIAHAVLARRMHARDPGSAPQVNDRIPYVFVKNSDKNALLGERIEHVEYVMRQSSPMSVIDTKAYIERQIMKPCLQLLGIALESISGYAYQPHFSLPDHDDGRALGQLGAKHYKGDLAKARERLDTLREREVQRLLFDPIMSLPVYTKQPKITSYFSKK
jgi:DNA polymerase elongation subunit (family B)